MVMVAFAFVGGLFLGSFLGVFLTALISVSHYKEDEL